MSDHSSSRVTTGQCDGARVSIVVRTKDRPAFLRRALLSIIDQRFDAWEVVIVNDGGDPALVETIIAERADALRDRVIVVHSPEARGRSVSANAGVLATTAPYLVLHDDDDRWHPEFLERAVAHLDAHEDELGVVSRIEIVRERSESDGFVEVEREMFQDHLPVLTLADTLLFNRFVPIGFLYRRRAHEELGLYDDRLPVVEDWTFYLRVLGTAPLEFLDGGPYAFWHHRPNETGPGGNSVNAARDAHYRHDLLVRDQALRDYVDEYGIGLPLYLTKFIDQRFVDVENGLRRDIENAVRELQAGAHRSDATDRVEPNGTAGGTNVNGE